MNDSFEEQRDDEVDEGRRVRQRTDDTERSAAGDLLLVLKGVRENTEQFRTEDDVKFYLQDQSAIPDEMIIETTRAFIDEWSSRHSDTKVVEGGRRVAMTTFEWAMGCDHPTKRFNLWHRMHSSVAEESISTTPKLLNVIAKSLKYMMTRLYEELKRRRLIVATREEEELDEGVCEEHFVRLANIITSSYEICVAELRIHVNLPDADGGGWTLYDAVGIEERMNEMHAMFIDRDSNKLTPFQNLHAHLLKLLSNRGYRKSGEFLYQPVRVNNLQWTGAWKPAYDPPLPSTFSHFFTENISRQIDFHAYLDATASFKNREAVIRQLIDEDEPECPTLVFNRLFISFNNAIVHMLGAVFPFDRQDQWQQIADRKNAEWAEFSKQCARRLADVGVEVDPFNLMARVMEETGEPLCIYPPTPDDATTKFIDEAIPEEYFDMRFDGSNFALGGAAGGAGDGAAGGEGDGACEYDPASPWDSPIFAYLDELRTPDFDRVQSTQRFDRATRFWDLATMGRGFLPGKTLDNLHFFPFHQGRAGTGKSLKLQVLQSYLPMERVGILSSKEGEKTFWGMGMQDKWVLFWLEVQNKEPPVDRGTLQQLVGMELVNLPQKGGKAVEHNWRAPLFLAGNEYFGYEDSQGSLRRRTLTFLYEHKPSAREPNLENVIKAKRGPLLLKMLHSYHLMLMLFPGMDWERSLPSTSGGSKPIIGTTLAEFQQKAVEQLDPLQAFVNQKGMFEFGPEHCMSENKFVEDYNAYRRMRGRRQTMWTEAQYQIVFEAKDIQRGMGDLQDPATGVIKPTPCLFGIAPKEDVETVM